MAAYWNCASPSEPRPDCAPVAGTILELRKPRVQCLTSGLWIPGWAPANRQRAGFFRDLPSVVRGDICRLFKETTDCARAGKRRQCRRLWPNSSRCVHDYLDMFYITIGEALAAPESGRETRSELPMRRRNCAHHD